MGNRFLFDDEQGQCVSLPGYKVGVILALKVAENQSQLAAVVWSEFAHVICATR